MSNNVALFKCVNALCRHPLAASACNSRHLAITASGMFCSGSHVASKRWKPVHLTRTWCSGFAVLRRPLGVLSLSAKEHGYPCSRCTSHLTRLIGWLGRRRHARVSHQSLQAKRLFHHFLHMCEGGRSTLGSRAAYPGFQVGENRVTVTSKLRVYARKDSPTLK